jgi:hypothetical protein
VVDEEKPHRDVAFATIVMTGTSPEKFNVGCKISAQTVKAGGNLSI